MDSLNDLRVGRFLGRYELLMPVAQGGMASVWAARLVGTRGFQKVVAIKTILPALSEDARFEQMFLDEASLASRIRHSNVAQVLDLGEEDGLLYQVMEWIDGEALNAFLRQLPDGSGMPFPIAAKIMIGACEGLHAAHELRDDNGTLVNLVHRDVSPQNILVSGDGVPKLVDFGVARANSLTSAQTQSGTLKGKPAYMAPEQIHGGDFDRRADIFSVGVILYVLTTGKHPFRGQNELATLHSICSPDPPTLPSSLRENYPKELEAVILHALEKDQAKRTKTAAAMARELEAAVPGVHKIGDADVATFMRTLLADRMDRRTQRLRKSLEEADERAQQAPDTEPQSSGMSRPRSPSTFPGLGGPTPALPTTLKPPSRPSTPGLRRPSSSGLRRPSSLGAVPPPPRRSSRPGQVGLKRGSAEPLPLAAKKRLPPVTPPPPRPSHPVPAVSAPTMPSNLSDNIDQEISSAVFSDEVHADDLPKKSSAGLWISLGVASIIAIGAAAFFLLIRPRLADTSTDNANTATSATAATASPSATPHPSPAPTGSSTAISVDSLPPAAGGASPAATSRVPGKYTWPAKTTGTHSTPTAPTAPAASAPAPTAPAASAPATTAPAASATAAKPPPADTNLTGTVPKIRDPGL